MSSYLVHDIETIPETELRNEWEADKAKQQAKGVADPFPGIPYHRVICIGMLTLDANLHPVRSGCAEGGVRGGKSEQEMIEKWAQVAAGGATDPLRLVDWHGRGFDVPVMQTRAFRYGIQLPWYFGKLPDNRGQISSFSKDYRDRYGGWHEDLAEFWTNRGAFPRPHLASLAKLMGLPGKLDVDGSNVYDLWKEYAHAKDTARTADGTLEQHEAWIASAAAMGQKIDTYCMQDVFQTGFILQRCRYMVGELSLEAYRAAAMALLEHVKRQPEQEDFVKGVDLPRLLLES